MATIDLKTAQYQQRKVSQQIARQAQYGKKADPERLAAIAAANATARVRVVPSTPLMRKFLKHEPSKIGFRDQGSAEWPLDRFTIRRLRDGDVTVETQDVELRTEHSGGGPRARASAKSE